MKDQYPADYHPPHHGVCGVCRYPTKGWTKAWLGLCPQHWQELAAAISRNG